MSRKGRKERKIIIKRSRKGKKGRKTRIKRSRKGRGSRGVWRSDAEFPLCPSLWLLRGRLALEGTNGASSIIP